MQSAHDCYRGLDGSNPGGDVSFKKELMNNSKLFGVEKEGCTTVEYNIKKEEVIQIVKL